MRARVRTGVATGGRASEESMRRKLTTGRVSVGGYVRE
jgi:hypothetical protein